MNQIARGMAAGLLASIALWFVIYARQAAGMAGTDPEQLMTVALGRLGMHIRPSTGWTAHLVIGTVVWGGLFGLFNDWMPARNEIAKGLCFSFLTWMTMIVFLLPLAALGNDQLTGAGFSATVKVTLAIHLLFGAVLGAAYAAMTPISASARNVLTD
jgi:hypothetical protein